MVDILQSYKHKYTEQGLIWSVVATVFLVVLGAQYSYNLLGKEYDQRLSGEFRRVLLGTQQALHVWADEHLKRAEVIASNDVVIKSALALNTLDHTDAPGLIESASMHALREFFLPRLSNSSYQGFFVINDKNVSLASSRDANVGTENLLAQQPDMLARAWAGETVISRVQRSDVPLARVTHDPKLNSISMFVISPLRDRLGRTFSLLALRLNPHDSFFPILERQQLGSSAETYAFDRTGVMLSDSRFHSSLYEQGLLSVPERSAGRLVLHDPRTPESLTLAVQRAVLGETGESFSGYNDYVGNEVVGAWLWDEQFGIGLTTEQWRSESHSLLYKLRVALVVIAVLVVGMLALVAVAAQFSRRRVKETRDILQSVVSTASDGIVLIDQRGVIMSVNSAVTETFGYSREELIGQNVRMLMPTGHRERHDGYISSYLETGEKQIIGKGRETEGQAKDGRIIPVLLTVNAFDLGGEVYFSGFLKDITDLKRTEMALKETSAELGLMALVAEKTDNAVIVADLQGRIVWCNPGFTSITGYELDEVRGQRPGDFLQGEGTDKHAVHKISEALRNGERIETELLNYSKSGEPYWVNLEITPVFDEHGEIQRFIALESNITVQKEINFALKKAKDEADQANRAKSTFLATMSHEIRTPLNGIVATMDLLNHDGSLQDEQRKLVQTACDSSVTLMHIIDDILDFSKIEAGRVEIDNQPFNIEHMLEQVGDSLASFADQKGVELLIFCEPSLGQVAGDIVQLKQVLFNLVGNAIKFSQDNDDRQGRVLVTIMPATNGSADIVIKVIDNGIGMSKQTQAKLFAPFVQGESNTTRRFGGTGLGLVITQRLLNLMGGRITLESEEGVGSTFTVTLPLERIVAKEEGVLSDLSEAQIILLQNDRELASIVTGYLHSVGARCHPYTPEALEQLERCCREGKLQGEVIVLIDACADERLRSQLVERVRTHCPDTQLRFLLLERGHQRYVQRRSDNTLALDINNMKRSALINAVAALAGLESPLIDQTQAPESLALSELLSETGRVPGAVLLADDNEVNQLVISQQLKALGYRVDMADDGKQALDMWLIQQHDLVLTDCHMPVLDGYQLAREIRAVERPGAHTPIIAITADALKGTREKCLNAGMDDYLTKPVELMALKTCMDRWYPVQASDSEPGGAVRVESVRLEEIDPDALTRVLGTDDPDVLSGFYEEFVTKSRPVLQSLKAAFERGDLQDVAAEAHKLKSSAKTVGAMAMSECCVRLEQAGKVQNQEGVDSAIPELEHRFNQFHEWAATFAEERIQEQGVFDET
ncbi:PAS domain S-box protein [Pontibacterium granulatum]|uniref:hybrid sensor histidine kinase/response regulator n=1 Tax=Pontibacterium granulatum TaxID=2036029 RepID=UPI00249CAF8E|nr:PAS domain S-box protein [Pontibacterium granulatum]MDI3323141.1 PAS domain S-box protein [Pontibacterium granulatum]